MQETTLSLAKTTQPTLSAVLERERLFARLDAEPAARAVWIAGPPGSGKTTLIASYLAARKPAALWYQLDAADADEATFFHYLRRTAIRRSRSDDRLPNLPAHGSDWPGFARRLFRAIFARFREPPTVVFDNYDTLPPHAGLHALLAGAIDEVPKGARLVFAGRADPPPAFARARIGDALTVIDAEALELDEDEYPALAELRNARVAPEVLAQIRQASAGWVTGAILLLELARKSSDLGSALLGSTGGVLFDYVAEEVFSGFDAATRDFLIRICWPRRLSVRLAAALSGEGSARQLLANLARNNYFVTERDDTGECEYIVHPLLRDFLKAQARRAMDEPAIAAIEKRTAELLVDDGQPEEAIELLAANLEWGRMEAVISSHARLLMEQGRSALLGSWLQELPRDRLNDDPWLLYWCARARERQSAREARRYFEMSFRRFEIAAPDDARGRALACCGIVEAILSEMDDFSLLDPWVHALTDLAAQHPELSESAETGAIDVLILIALVLRNPTRREFGEWFQRAERALKRAEAGDGAGRRRLWLILAHSLTGQFDRSEAALAAHPFGASETGDSRSACHHLLLASLNGILQGDGDAAARAADACLALIEEHALPGLMPFAEACQCGAAVVRRDPERADEWLARLAASAASGNRVVRFLAHYLASWRALIEEDPVKALQEQRKAQACASELGIFFLEVLSSVAFAQLLFLCRDARGGSAQLRRVHSIARDVHNPLLEFMTLLIYSEVAMRERRASSGANALRYALGLGRLHGYYHVPWWHPRQLADLCATALRQKIEVDYVRELVRRRALQPSRPPIDIPDWPWPVTITTLGGFRLSQAGGERDDPGRKRSRPLQLLKILIALGGRDVGADVVAKMLWPHVDPYYSEKSLTINLHRLRRLLGSDDAIQLRDGRLSIDGDHVWLDAWALEHVVARLGQLTRTKGQGADAAELDLTREQLLDLYAGAFLPGDDDAPCLAEARERAREQFVRGLDLLSEGSGGRVDGDRAIALYEIGLGRDPGAELLYQRLMLQYRNQNRAAEARETFERCRRALAGTSQAEPSQETQALFDSLVFRN
jgi:ATP/maltotriose-dependent transcriptional regulator MalT/DNA-binding SARP family transcriptional activator